LGFFLSYFLVGVFFLGFSLSELLDSYLPLPFLTYLTSSDDSLDSESLSTTFFLFFISISDSDSELSMTFAVGFDLDFFLSFGF